MTAFHSYQFIKLVVAHWMKMELGVAVKTFDIS